MFPLCRHTSLIIHDFLCQYFLHVCYFVIVEFLLRNKEGAQNEHMSASTMTVSSIKEVSYHTSSVHHSVGLPRIDIDGEYLIVYCYYSLLSSGS